MGEDVPEDGGEDGSDFEVDEVVGADEVVVLHEFDDGHGDESFEEVEGEDGGGGAFSEDAEHVGRSCVFRTVLADVDAVVFLADPHGARNRAQQIGNDNHGGSGINGQNHIPFG